MGPIKICNQHKIDDFEIFKISPTIVTFLNLGNLEAASEETMELRELINKSNESLILVLEFLGPKT